MVDGGEDQKCFGLFGECCEEGQCVLNECNHRLCGSLGAPVMYVKGRGGLVLILDSLLVG